MACILIPANILGRLAVLSLWLLLLLLMLLLVLLLVLLCSIFSSLVLHNRKSLLGQVSLMLYLLCLSAKRQPGSHVTLGTASHELSLPVYTVLL